MSEYKADLRDIRFVLFEFLKIQDLQGTEVFGDFGKDDYETFLTESYRFAREVLAPLNEPGDKIGVKFDDGVVTEPPEFVEAYKKYMEAGWVGAVQEAELGGYGLPFTMGQVIHEFFLGACISFSLTTGLSEGVINLLAEWGSEDLKKLFVPKMLTAEWSGTMCLTEAGAGSDVGASKTTAVKLDNGRYRIEGTKIFITGGDHDMAENVVHAVLARTPDAPPGVKGLSLFIVPKYLPNEAGEKGEFNDVKVGRIEHKMGIKGSPTCVMNFGEDGKCEGYLLGKELDGIKIMFQMMNEARVMVGCQGLTLAAAAYQSALDYTKERLQGPNITQMKDPKAPRVPIIQHPDVRRMLMYQKAVTEGLRALLYSVAYYADRARADPDENERKKYHGWLEVLTPICKAYGSDMGFLSCNEAVQCLGGYGYVNEYPNEQYLRDARIAPIYEGTNGIQALDLIGRKLGMKGGALFMSYMKEVQGFVMKTKGHPNVGKMVAKLGEATTAIGQLAMKFATVGMQDIIFPTLNAYTFMTSFGHTCAAFYLLQEAVIADEQLQKLYKENNAVNLGDKKKLAEDNPEVGFYLGKVLSAQYFCTNILPEVKANSEKILSGDKSPMDVVF
ncbi:MAG: acyl-CoA dehydrogenase [Deltaproteobacteria bacterium]|nr:acyl-CoA dehydrogenase [Deltaproteobacteria bacterium]